MSTKKVLTFNIAKQFLADNHSVRLGSFASIEDEAAAALAKYKGGLDLSGLRSLDAAVARALSKHCEALGLLGLKKLSDEAAQALGKHKGPLFLSGLESLSDCAAEALSKHKAPLYLTGLLKLSPHAAAHFARNPETALPFILRPEAAAGLLEVSGERHSAKRPAIRSKKLKALQIVLPVKKRPVHQIRTHPELLENLQSHIAELQPQSETALDRTALDRLKSCLESTPGPCTSFHFPLPDSVADSTTHGDWEETCNSLDEWATRELNALDTCLVDVENLTESCNECINFTSSAFRHCRHVKEDLIITDAPIQWRCIGDEVGVIAKDKIDQYEVPPHELSDLFNRALPPERTMVYFDMGANGLYVLMETEGMEDRLSKVLVGKATPSTPRTPDKARDKEPDGASDFEPPDVLSWLDAASTLDSKVETFTRYVEDLKSEQALFRVFGEGEGAKLFVDFLSLKDAELLASFPGEILEIRFRGPISDEAATALAGFQGSQLDLSGISDLSETALKTLLGPKRSYLAILRDSPSPNPEDGRAIAVDFPLSDACIKKIQTFKSDRLFLKGIADLSDAGAKSLSSFKGDLLCLDGITDLSEASATALASSRCEQLRLDGLKTLSPAVAAALAKSRCNILHLNGVKTISDATAEALSGFKEGDKRRDRSFELSLNGVGFLSDASTKALASTKVFTLSLGGLKEISDLGLINLSQFDGVLKIGIKHISDAAAKLLGKFHRNGLYLNALTEISDQAITEIAPSIDHKFSLCGLRKLSVTAAQVISSFSCTVRQYPTDYGFIHLDGLETLSVAVAEELAKTTATLHLNGLTILGDDEARALSKHKGALQLNGITSLTDCAVEALAKHVGDLNLCGLDTLSDTSAAHLAKHEGTLGLSGLRKLSETAADHLSKRTGLIKPAPPAPIHQHILALRYGCHPRQQQHLENFRRFVSLDCADSLIWSDSEGTEGSDPSRVFERDTPGDCLELGV